MRQSVGPRDIVMSAVMLTLYATLLSTCHAWCPTSGARRYVPARVPHAVDLHSEDGATLAYPRY